MVRLNRARKTGLIELDGLEKLQLGSMQEGVQRDSWQHYVTKRLLAFRLHVAANLHKSRAIQAIE